MGITKDAFEAPRRAQIYAAATELAAQGQTPTNDAVHALVGGGRRFITETMKAWRHEHPSPTNGAGPPALAPGESPRAHPPGVPLVDHHPEADVELGMALIGFASPDAPVLSPPVTPEPAALVLPDVEALHAAYRLAVEVECRLGAAQQPLKRQRDESGRRLPLLKARRDHARDVFNDAVAAQLTAEIEALQADIAQLDHHRQRLGHQREEASRGVILAYEDWQRAQQQARRWQRQQQRRAVEEPREGWDDA